MPQSHRGEGTTELGGTTELSDTCPHGSPQRKKNGEKLEGGKSGLEKGEREEWIPWKHPGMCRVGQPTSQAMAGFLSQGICFSKESPVRFHFGFAFPIQPFRAGTRLWKHLPAISKGPGSSCFWGFLSSGWVSLAW